MNKTSIELKPASPRHRMEAEKCLGCRLCQAACPVGALELDQGRPLAGPDCRQCAACLEICPVEAFSAPGKARLES